MVSMWKKKKKNYGKNSNYSLSRKLQKDKRITEEFEVMLNSLTLEEVIGLKLELGARSINYKMYGLPIWSAIPTIVKEATLKCAVSITRTKGEAARFLGLNRSHLKQLIRKYEIDNYFEEDNT